MEKHTLFISDERKLELFKKHYVRFLGGDIDCKVEVVNGVTMNVVSFPSDLPTTMLIQYVWSIGVSTGLELCQSIINGTSNNEGFPIPPTFSGSYSTSPTSPLDKVVEEPEKKL